MTHLFRFQNKEQLSKENNELIIIDTKTNNIKINNQTKNSLNTCNNSLKNRKSDISIEKSSKRIKTNHISNFHDEIIDIDAEIIDLDAEIIDKVDEIKIPINVNINKSHKSPSNEYINLIEEDFSIEKTLNSSLNIFSNQNNIEFNKANADNLINNISPIKNSQNSNSLNFSLNKSKELSPLEVSLFIGDPQRYEEKFIKRYENRLSNISSNLSFNSKDSPNVNFNNDEIIIIDSDEDTVVNKDSIINLDRDEIKKIVDSHSEICNVSFEGNESFQENFEFSGINQDTIETINSINIVSNIDNPSIDFNNDKIGIDNFFSIIYNQNFNYENNNNRFIHYNTNSIVFDKFKIDLFPELNQFEITVFQNFIILPRYEKVDFDLNSLKSFEGKCKFLKFESDRIYSFNLHNPLIFPKDFIRLFHYLSIFIESDVLLYLFESFQPQYSIVFQSIIQMREFQKEMINIIPILSKKNIIFSNLTLLEVDESFMEDELVSIFRNCVQSLYEFKFHHNDGSLYIGEIMNPLNAIKNSYSTSLIPYGQGYSFKINENGDVDKYFGFWKDAKMHGEGIRIYGNYEYKGEFLNNLFDGKGILIQRGNNNMLFIYEGEFSEGKKNGYGKLILFTIHNNIIKRKEWFEGNWKNDQRYGFGELRSETYWKLGNWKKYFTDGCGITLNNKTKFFERNIKENNSEEKTRSIVPKSYFEQLIHPQLSNSLNTAQRVLYSGYCFRSRLETRWAIFFESLKIDYLYECKKFIFPDKRTYTPDFYLPDLKMWIEIKPMQPTMEELEKVKILSQLLSRISNKYRAILIYGNCEPPHMKKHRVGALAAEYYFDGSLKDSCMWVNCPYCNKIDIIERGKQLDCPCNKSNIIPEIPSSTLQFAYETAQKFDFEGYMQHLKQFYEEMHFEADELADND